MMKAEGKLQGERLFISVSAWKWLALIHCEVREIDLSASTTERSSGLSLTSCVSLCDCKTGAPSLVSGLVKGRRASHEPKLSFCSILSEVGSREEERPG